MIKFKSIIMPDTLQAVIHKLEQHGYEAYIVGGCVRDSILGIKPHDWDICTSASSVEILNIFKHFKAFKLSSGHGTIAIHVDDNVYEITPYRINHDHINLKSSDSNLVTTGLVQDLSLRDFTMNAIAYNDKTGFIDPFGGINDINNTCIKCVGNAEDRIKEDALRILRAARFCCQFNFSLSRDTSDAILSNVKLLDSVAEERIQTEIRKMIVQPLFGTIFLRFKTVFFQIVPEFKGCFRFEQNNPYHIFDVLDHIITSVMLSDTNDEIIKLALLFHDIGKPECYSIESRIGHFYMHANASYVITNTVLKRLRFPNKLRENVADLVKYHDAEIIPDLKHTRRWLYKIGQEQYTRLLHVKMADIRAQNPMYLNERIILLNDAFKVLDTIRSERACFSINNLDITGYDIMNVLNIKEGKEVGNQLTILLNLVIGGYLCNEKEILIEYIKDVHDGTRKPITIDELDNKEE